MLWILLIIQLLAQPGGNQVTVAPTYFFQSTAAADCAAKQKAIPQSATVYAVCVSVPIVITAAAPPSPAPAPVPAPSGLSPPGSVLSSSIVPGGQLVTAAGTWTFSASVAGCNMGDQQILLNGASAAGGCGIKLAIASDNNLYTVNNGGSWYRWNNGSWAGVAAKPAGVP